MTNRKAIFLKVATIQGILIGGYHLALPYHWNWHEYTTELPGMIEWSLYALNFLFSVLLIIISSLTYYFSKKSFGSKTPSLVLIGSCGLFWLLDIGYQLFAPVPSPQQYPFIGHLFLAAAILNLCLYSISFNLYKKGPSSKI